MISYPKIGVNSMIIRFKPILFDKIWGGTNFKKIHRTNLSNIGEFGVYLDLKASQIK